jgi:hypothetical protein
MARRPKKIALSGIHPFEAQAAASTIARAHEHLQNPKMMKAIRSHIDSMNAAVSGGLKPVQPRANAKRKGMP